MGDVLWTGSRVGGYEVVRLLGRGGMGAVYEARDPAGRSVALKVILGGVLLDADLRRFEREARAAAAISHPNVTRVHAAGEDHGRAFIVFELVQGGSLGQQIKERGRLPWPEAVAHAIGIARGLEAIHSAGFVHRDLKPDNVLLDEQGTPKVADLGLVRRTSAASIALTATGELLGTPSYMAPEQVDHAKSVDARADVYALGATLFALVTGEPPFAGVGPKVLFAVIQTPPPRLSQRAPGVPPALEGLVLECLAKDPSGRPASAGIVAGRLEAIAKGKGAAPRRRLGFALAALGGAGLLAGAGALTTGWRPLGKARPDGAHAGASPAPSPPSPDALLAKGSAALKAHRPEDAISLATRVLDLEPANVHALVLRATAREELWRVPEAFTDAEAAVACSQGSAPAYAIRAAVRADQRRYEDAVTDATRALELDPRCLLAVAVEAEARFWILDSKDGAEAIAAVRRAGNAVTKDAPELARGWIDLGLMAFRGGDETPRADFRTYARKALDRAPRSPWALYLVARSWGDERPRTVALDALRQALEIDPSISQLWATSAHWKKEEGDLDGSLADADKALARSPVDTTAWNARGLILLDRGQLDAAIAAATARLDDFPHDYVAEYVLGDAYRRMGDREKALPHLMRSADRREWRWAGPVAGILEIYVLSGDDPTFLLGQCDLEKMKGESGELDRVQKAYATLSAKWNRR